MSKYIEKVEKTVLPAIRLRQTVVFPGIPTSLELDDACDIAAINSVQENERYVFAASYKFPDKKSDEIYSFGTAAKIRQAMLLPDGHMRVLLEGKSRAELISMNKSDDSNFFSAEIFVRSVSVSDKGGIRGELLMKDAVSRFQELIKFLPKVSSEIIVAVQAINDPGFLADFITANIIYNNSSRQEVLSEINPVKRLEKLLVIMEKEMKMLENELELQAKVKARIDQNQREYFLREQMKTIQNELGDGEYSDIDEYEEKIAQARLPEYVEEKLLKEVSKLEKMPYSSAESTVIRNYLDVCLEIPWSVYSKGRCDVAAAKKILDADHDGLDKVKDRILEFIAVKQLSPKLAGQIICLVGPPGVGKSSVVSSVAKALGRKFVRVSLGGVRDEADIRGHRKTYIASMPGRIATALKSSGTMNPVILLDEVDKLASDAHGDPASALLEVLDNDQNKTFRDHFIEIPLDLSECVFMATANTLDTVPRPLIDRMEIIEINSYTRSEKLAIFKNHLLPKELKRHGLTKRNLKISDDAAIELIDYYTKESGVRNLSRETAALCRKVARKIAETDKKSYSLTAENISEYLGKRKFRDPENSIENLVGVVNGLAWTEVGGEMLKAEAVAAEGTGKLELTGKLGDVMKESAQAAVTYVRKNYAKYGIDREFYKNRDIHIHFPEGAVPKDGPSAGVTCVTAVVSELSGIPVRGDVAMTGEITLHGKVLPIGGLREKSMAAYKNGMKTVIIPHDNAVDLDDVDSEVRENVVFIPVKTVDEVLENALCGTFNRSDELAEDLTNNIYIPAASSLGTDEIEIAGRTI